MVIKIDKLQLSLYDLLAYLVPGVLALWIFGVVFHWISGDSLLMQGMSDWINAVLFIASAYFVGHIMQSLGNRLESFLFDTWGGWPSQRLLKDEEKWQSDHLKKQDKWSKQSRLKQALRAFIVWAYPPPTIRRAHYSSGVRERILGSARDYFGLGEQSTPQEIFDLCYSTIVAENVPSLVSVFNAFFSLYRGMVVVCLSCAAILLGGGVASVVYSKWQPSPFNTTTAFILAGVFLVLAHLFTSRYRRFGEHFAHAVYRTFYVYICRSRSSK